MEPDFNDIALSKLLQTFPELGNLILTFKDVSDDLPEDTGISVGVFILRSGEEIFYVPVVSKEDNVYPIDSIFFASKSKFFPLTKKTVASVLASSQLTQGRPKKIPSTVALNPDVSQLINPPRTGKYVSASTSRLGDFLAAMPDYLKSFTMEKVAEEKSVYEELHKLFSLRDIFAALKPAPGGLAQETNKADISIVTGGPTISTDDVNSILNKGYAISGAHTATRVAVSAESYGQNNFTRVQELDGNSDYELALERGTSREAFIPKILNIGQNGSRVRNTVALFTNGDYAIEESFIAVGGKLDRKNVLSTIFNYNPPVLPRDVTQGNKFAILDTDGNLLGVFSANKVILSHLGVEIDATVYAGFSSSTVRIHAYRSYGVAPSCEGRDIYIPFSSLVLILGDNIGSHLERSVMGAARRREISGANILGDQLNIGYDGVEFSINGATLGKEANVMQRLVVEEGIDPLLATSFVKQAKERKFAKVYLSKKAAAFNAGEIPQFGEQPAPQGKTGLNGSFMPNVQKSLVVGDAQTTEATIISELLQAPDMYELIAEYMPDLEEATDKLGRILFLSRVHISQLADNNDADGVFAFLSSLKTVYRLLGDNLIKLQELLALKPNEKK